jgi:hypothetical protein
MNQTLIHDLARQYMTDLNANIILSPDMISLQSTQTTGPQCIANRCPRYEWFSKVMLSGIIADLVYASHGCAICRRIDLTEAATIHNISLQQNFGDGLRENGQDWIGHYYPRGIISWAFLNAGY